MAIKAGQQATTLAAVALPSATFSSGPVTLKAPGANAAPILIGPPDVTAGTGFVMQPGDSVSIPVSNLNQVCLLGANTTDKITWIGI